MKRLIACVSLMAIAISVMSCGEGPINGEPVRQSSFGFERPDSAASWKVLGEQLVAVMPQMTADYKCGDDSCRQTVHEISEEWFELLPPSSDNESDNFSGSRKVTLIYMSRYLKWTKTRSLSDRESADVAAGYVDGAARLLADGGTLPDSPNIPD